MLAPVGQLLLELVAGILDTLACGLNVVDRNASVTEPFVWLGVAVGDLVAVVGLGTVIVGEFDDA